MTHRPLALRRRGLFRVAQMCVALVAVALVVGSALPAGAVSASAWKLTTVKWSVPGPANDDGFTAVSCVSADFCVATGDENWGSYVSFYNGSGWTLAQLPAPANAINWTLDAISCVSTTFCAAVGEVVIASATGQQYEALVATYDGTGWTVGAVAQPGDSSLTELLGVSCWADGSCAAVGTTGTELQLVPLVVTLAGGTWTASTPPNPGDQVAGVLTGVSCFTGPQCVAVGSATDESNDVYFLSDTYDGSSWTATSQALSDPGYPDFQFGFVSLSCSAPTLCAAVGDDDLGTFLAKDVAGSWTFYYPDVHYGELDAVSCLPSADYLGCVSVGASLVTQALPEIAVDFNGDWTTQTLASPSGAVEYSELSSVSCVSDSMCVAVGSAESIDLSTLTVSNSALVEISQGSTWTATFPAAPPGPADAYAEAVSCGKPRSCVAVGNEVTAGETVRSIAVTGAVGRWVAARPGQLGNPSALTDVSCADGQCTAVGTVPEFFVDVGLLVASRVHNHWSAKKLPYLKGYRYGALTAVTCVSATRCVAVGYESKSGSSEVDTAVIATRNGSKWSVQAVPNLKKTTGDQLRSIACRSVNWCVATGGAYTKNNEVGIAITESKGKWKTAVVPEPKGATVDSLVSVSCATVGHCSAITDYDKGTTEHTELLVDTGGTWKLATFPKPAHVVQALFLAISCPALSACVAVGGGTDLNDLEHPIVAGQTTHGWTSVRLSSPPGAQQSELDAVSCWAVHGCAAVGVASVNGGNEPLAALTG